MILRVIKGYGPVDLDGEAPARREIGIAHVVLRSEAGGGAEILWPPACSVTPFRCEKTRRPTANIPPRALTLGLKGAGGDKVRFATDKLRQFNAQGVHARFQRIVEHVRDHDR